MATKEQPQQSSNNTQAVQVAIDRVSLVTDLETRYNKSKIKEVRSPVAVDDFSNQFATGFTIKQTKTSQTGKESVMLKGFSNKKYHG